jgi:hypothetical protein
MTADDANRTLSALEEIFARLEKLKDELAARANELERMGYNEATQPAYARGTPLPEPIAERRRILQARTREFQSEVAKIAALGAVLEDLDLQVVDFPCVIHGKDARLCWQRGESQVQHFHPPGARFAERRRLPR